jgi:hypothetical protein
MVETGGEIHRRAASIATHEDIALGEYSEGFRSAPAQSWLAGR